MITEVKLEDIEKAFKNWIFIQRIEAGGKSPKDYAPKNLEALRDMYSDAIDDEWTSIIDAATIGDAESGKVKLNYISFLIRYIKAFGFKFINIREDIYKFKEHFEIFNQYKNQFDIKDLGQIKSQPEFQEWVNKAIDIKQQILFDPSKSKGKSAEEKYKDLFAGETNGFKIYKIPHESQWDEEKDKNYYYAASCELGSGTEWCTATGKTKQYFDSYVQDGPLFIIVNPSRSKFEKYQYHAESDSFMDERDVSVWESTPDMPIYDNLEAIGKLIEKAGGRLTPQFIIAGNLKGREKDIENWYVNSYEPIIDEVLEQEYVGEYLQEVANGNVDRHPLGKLLVKEELDPYNAANWVRVLSMNRKNWLSYFPKDDMGEVEKQVAQYGGFYLPSFTQQEIFWDVLVKPTLEKLEGKYRKTPPAFEYEGQL